MRRTRRIAPVVVVATLSLLVTACAANEKSSEDGRDSTAPGTASGSIPIGVDIELSGPASVQGTAYKNALELAASEINKNGVLGGRKINLIVRDNKSDPTQSLQIAKSFIGNDKVAGIVGGGSTPTTLSIVDTVEGAGVPTVSMGSSGAIISPPDKRNLIFKTPANTGQVADVMLADMKSRGFKRIGFISVDNPYGDAGLKAFQAIAKRGGIEIVAAEKFTDADRDLTTQLTKLAGANPEAIVSWAIPPGAGIVAKSAKAVGYKGQLYFDAGAGAELFLRGAGDAADGVLLVHPTVLVGPDAPKSIPNYDVMTDFYKAYTERYGDYSGFASYAADALHLLVEAMEKAGSTDGRKVADALEQLNYTGVTGVYHMTPEDHSGLRTESLSLLTVRNGKWTLAH